MRVNDLSDPKRKIWYNEDEACEFGTNLKLTCLFACLLASPLDLFLCEYSACATENLT